MSSTTALYSAQCCLCRILSYAGFSLSSLPLCNTTALPFGWGETEELPTRQLRSHTNGLQLHAHASQPRAGGMT